MPRLSGIIAEIRDFFFSASAVPTDQESFDRTNQDDPSVNRVFNDTDVPDSAVFKKLAQSTAFLHDIDDRALSSEDNIDPTVSATGVTVRQGLVTIATDAEAVQRNDGTTAEYTRTVRPSHIVVSGKSDVNTVAGLAAIPTENTPIGVQFHFVDSNNELYVYKLVTGANDITDDTSLSNPFTTIKPVDYNASDPNTLKVWKRTNVYNTSLDTDLQVPTTVGGIVSTTPVSALKNKSFTQLFDDLLFPTVLATITTSKSGSLSGVTPTGIREIGTALSFTLTADLNRGIITSPTTPPATVELVGAVSAGTPYTFTGAAVGTQPQAGNTLLINTNVTSGSNQWGVTITHDAGSGTYTDNKGNVRSNLDASRVSGIVTANSSVITGVFARFYGAVVSTPSNSTQVRALPSGAELDTNNQFTLNTGNTLTKYVVVLPPGRTITQVIDLDALNAVITSSYVNNGSITVNDVGGTARTYTIFEMNNGVPYSTSHRHQITIS